MKIIIISKMHVGLFDNINTHEQWRKLFKCSGIQDMKYSYLYKPPKLHLINFMMLIVHLTLKDISTHEKDKKFFQMFSKWMHGDENNWSIAILMQHKKNRKRKILFKISLPTYLLNWVQSDANLQ